MKFKIFYGNKISFKNSDFNSDKYICKKTFKTKNGAPVVICRNKENDIWKVMYNSSEVVFATYEEALEFCKIRFTNNNN